MNINSGKYDLFISGHKFEDLWAKIGDDKIWETGTVKPLVITIDNELKFDEHLNNVFLKANRKLSALMRIIKFLDFNKTRMLFEGFFDSQFKYCPRTWMFYSRNLNHRINILHEKAFSLLFEKRLEKADPSTVHH